MAGHILGLLEALGCRDVCDRIKHTAASSTLAAHIQRSSRRTGESLAMSCQIPPVPLTYPNYVQHRSASRPSAAGCRCPSLPQAPSCRPYSSEKHVPTACRLQTVDRPLATVSPARPSPFPLARPSTTREVETSQPRHRTSETPKGQARTRETTDITEQRRGSR